MKEERRSEMISQSSPLASFSSLLDSLPSFLDLYSLSSFKLGGNEIDQNLDVSVRGRGPLYIGLRSFKSWALIGPCLGLAEIS